MNSSIVRILALVATVGVAACGDDPIGVTGDPLSDVEAAALSNIVMGAAIQATASGTPSASPAVPGGPQPVPFSYSAQIDTSVPCTGGGSVGLSGSATIDGDDETQEFTADYDLRSSFSECTEFAPEAEQDFTISGDLHMTASLDYSVPEGSETPSLSSVGTFEGGVSWSAEDGRMGTCPVNLRSEVTTSGESISASTTGTFCNTTINQTFSYGAPVT